jgi:hypothetical protein
MVRRSQSQRGGDAGESVFQIPRDGSWKPFPEVRLKAWTVSHDYIRMLPLTLAVTMNLDFRRALGLGVTTVFVSVALAALLAQAADLERPGVGMVLGRLIGHGGLGVVMLLALETPILIVLGWLTRGRIVVPRIGWALIGATLAMAPIVAANVPGESVWVKISETFDVARSQPLIFVTEWLPFPVSGGVFGWYFFVSQRHRLAKAV